MQTKIKLLAMGYVLTLSDYGFALNLKQCLQIAHTPYEQAYCQVKSAGKGKGLPSLEDFIQAAPRTQWLLVRRDAKSLGLPLSAPKESQTNSEPIKVQPLPLKQSLKALSPEQPPSSHETTPKPAIAPIHQQCLLKESKLHCQNTTFILSENTKVTWVMNEIQNQNFPRQPESFTPQAKHTYLTQAYRYYIKKMLSLGLGDSTMSLTKFAALLDNSLGGSHRFDDRFEQVFKKLEADKQSLSTQSRYQSDYPKDISWCWPLSDAIYICDNIKTNWVYTRQ